MAHAHFKDKLMKDLEDKSPPFRCPAPDCSYQTRERDKWSRHYGSVHGFIKKYLKQYFDEHPEEKRSVSSNNIDQTSQLPNTLTSPLSSDTSINEMSNTTKESNNAQDSPHLKTVKEKFILKVHLKQYICYLAYFSDIQIIMIIISDVHGISEKCWTERKKEEAS